MPIPPPRHFSHLPEVMAVDTCAVLADCREQYRLFVRTMRQAKDAGEFRRMPREQVNGLREWQKDMRSEIFHLEIAVTEICN